VRRSTRQADFIELSRPSPLAAGVVASSEATALAAFFFVMMAA